MKSLSVVPSTIDFGKQAVGNKRSKNVLITNTGTENCELSGIATKGAFSSDLPAKTIPPAYPVNATLYLVNVGGKRVLQNVDGSFQTTNLGYGAAGKTDSEGKLTLGYMFSSIEIDSVNNGVNMELVGMYTDGVKYFFGTNGEVVAEGDPDATDIFYGTGNSDGFIDVDISTIQLEVLGYIDGEYVVNIKGSKTIID